MLILLYGMNHSSAPIELRERVAVPSGQLVDAVRRLVRLDSIEEGLILSTCNRTELLAKGRDETAGRALKEFLLEERRVTEEELEQHCYLYAGREAVRHIFRVASSLDSMVLGEAQILGQVKEAYGAATEAGGLRTILDALMQRAFSVAKKVRTDTGIARSPVSIAHAAAGLARDIFGDLQEKAILVLGAGEMGRLAARHLSHGGVRSIVVVNRSFQGAVELARELGGRPSPFDRLLEEMELADIVIASTSAPHHVVRYEDGVRLKRARRGRPLFLVDIAVPRDIDPRINELENVYLYDIDELGEVVQRTLEARRKEAVCAEAIVERETTAYVSWLRTLQVAPTIVDLRTRLHGMAERELHRFHGRLASLTPEQRNVVKEITRALINKVLHQPIQSLKRSAARPELGDQVQLFREVFGLDGDGGSVERTAGSTPIGDEGEESRHKEMSAPVLRDDDR